MRVGILGHGGGDLGLDLREKSFATEGFGVLSDRDRIERVFVVFKLLDCALDRFDVLFVKEETCRIEVLCTA